MFGLLEDLPATHSLTLMTAGTQKMQFVKRMAKMAGELRFHTIEVSVVEVVVVVVVEAVDEVVLI